MPFFQRRSSRAPAKDSEEESSGSGREKQDVREKDEDFDLNIRKITLQLGETTATFLTDGSWHYSCDTDPVKHKLLTLKNKQALLMKRNIKLKEKYDTLFQKAEIVATKFAETEQELKSLRKILKNSPLKITKTKT